VGAITATIGWRPFIGPKARPLTDRKFDTTPARWERGKYLTEGVLGCFYCHSPRDWNLPGAPLIETSKGGGAVFEGGPPGVLMSPNISPDPETGAGNWTDDMLARAIREGIGHDGRALFPIMPYLNYRQLSDEDLASVVVYLRSIPPVRTSLPETKLDFPLNLLVKAMPQPLTSPVADPDMSDVVRRGEHLATLASCKECHTPQERGEPKAGLDLAGGFMFLTPKGEVASANITQDDSGISYYDETQFIQTIRTGRVKARELNPIMPTGVYGKMTDDDLKAIFAYLKTVKPIKHSVDNHEPATRCRLCGSNHGFGDRN
jgi:cytochrome c2